MLIFEHFSNLGIIWCFGIYFLNDIWIQLHHLYGIQILFLVGFLVEFVFTNAYLAQNYFWKKASSDHATFKENLANNLISYKTESNKLKSSNHPFKKKNGFGRASVFQISYGNLLQYISIVDMAVETAKECLQHFNVPHAKWIVGAVTY